MFNFNAVSENVYEQSLTGMQHTRSEHSYIDGGFIVKDQDEKILALEIPTSDANLEYYLSIDVAAAIH